MAQAIFIPVKTIFIRLISFVIDQTINGFENHLAFQSHSETQNLF